MNLTTNISFTYKNSIVLLLLLLSTTLRSQVTFEAKVSREKLGLNERLRVDFEMNEDGDNFRPPEFEGFRIVGGPNQSVSMSWLSGEKTFKKTYSFFLKPLKKGNLIIPKASIDIKGTTYKSTPITVTITDPIKKSSDPDSPAFDIEEGIHLVAEISNTNPYVNEPITVVHKLYVKPNISIRNWREINYPKYNDFWSQDIDIKNLKVEREMFRGEEYRYVVLRKNVLYPQKTGKLELEPLTLEVTIDVPTNRRDFFGSRITTTDNQTFSSKKRFINVKPLPEKNKPEGFTGAVGKFNFIVQPSKKEVKHGESLDVEVSVTGQGNLKLFNLPKPNFPSSLEVYDPMHSENVQNNPNGLKGKVSDKYTLIPEYRGNYPVKPVVFTYFDLESETYKQITSNEFTISVIDGPNRLDNGESDDNGNDISYAPKMEINKKSQFKYIKSDTALTAIDNKDFLGSKLYLFLSLIPFGLIPFIVIWKRQRDKSSLDTRGNKIRQSNKLAKKYLSEAKKNIGNKEQFYISLEKALHNFLKAKLSIETSEMRKDTIKNLLENRMVNSHNIDAFIDLLESCELARYTPSTSVTIKNDYEKAVEIVLELGKQI